MTRFVPATGLVAAMIFLVPTYAATAQAPDGPPDDPEPAAVQPRPPRDSMGGGMTGGPMGGGGGPPGYDAAWYPSQAVGGQRADLGFVRQGLNLGVPVWRDGGDMVMVSLGVRNTLFSTDAVLPDSGRPFPDQLWNLNLGANYMHRFENGWMAGLITGIGSPSDRPFHSIREVNATVGGMLRIPANDRDSWQFMLLYMSAGPVAFPLPMASYIWVPSDRLKVTIGLPVAVEWKPDPDLTVNLSYVPLYNVNARVTYRPAPEVAVYAGYEFLNESYFLAGRADERDRFFAFEQRLVTGLRWDVWKATVEANGGYSFGRYYGEGQSQWGALRDRVDVSPGPFVGVRVGLRF